METTENTKELTIEFIHNLKHDSHTLFAEIINLIEQMKLQEIALEKKENLACVAQSVQVLFSYLSEILKFISIENGKVFISKSNLDQQGFSKKQSRVLLVEDHSLSAKVVRDMLMHLYCHVDIAVSGKNTLDLINKEYYDLIFMDIGLPDMDGYEITRRIRSHEMTSISHIPIIALTAHTDIDNRQRCLDAKMNAVVSKPFTEEQAKNILNTFISRRKKEIFDTLADVDEDSMQKEKIIDFEYAKKLLNENETAVNEMLTMLVDSLPQEIEKLTEAYEQKNWETLSAIAHKLKGAASYCGTLRLKTICTELENYIKSGLTTRIAELYQQMLIEIEALRTFMKNRVDNQIS